MIKFLSFLLKKKQFKYGTFNTIRSALSLILPFDIGNNPHIKRFLKGVFRLRPPQRRYNFTWDTSSVLNHLEGKTPNDKLSLLSLSKKVATLLALVTGHRLQTLNRIRVEKIIMTHQGIQIFIPDHLKTTNKGNPNPCLQVPFFNARPAICPASCLNEYIVRTASLRTEAQEFLFITARPPHNTATSATISRWIKSTLSEANVDTTLFTAYSSRHASTTKAFTQGVSLQTIRKTAGWSGTSQVFARHYQLPVRNLQEFAQSLLNK